MSKSIIESYKEITGRSEEPKGCPGDHGLDCPENYICRCPKNIIVCWNEEVSEDNIYWINERCKKANEE